MFKFYPRNSIIVSKLLKTTAYAYTVFPVLSLLGWWALILFDAIRENQVTFPAWFILIIGVAYYITLYNIFKMFWSNYRMKNINSIISFVFFILT